MPRARNIKPSFFTNEILGTLDPIIGLTFIGLWCLADKEGRLEDRPLRIKAELFPYREGTDINGYLTVLERSGFIWRYQMENIRIIQVINFEKHQSPHHTEKPKGLPPKPLEIGQLEDLTVTSPLDQRELTVPTRSDSLIPDSLIHDHQDDLFERFNAFWKAYPKKKAKDDARKAFKKAKLNGSFDRVMAALEAQKKTEEFTKEDGKFVPYAATWLNGKRWEDEVDTPTAVQRPRIPSL